MKVFIRSAIDMYALMFGEAAAARLCVRAAMGCIAIMRKCGMPNEANAKEVALRRAIGESK
jgi:hypothetical protein